MAMGFTNISPVTTVDGCEILHHQKDGFSTPTKSWDVCHQLVIRISLAHPA
jgi:hypothetical protein